MQHEFEHDMRREYKENGRPRETKLPHQDACPRCSFPQIYHAPTSYHL